MIYTVPTKRGLGIQLWGNYDDLRTLYDVFGKFWNDPNYTENKLFEDRDRLISGFSYELRKAYEGSKLKRESSHFSLDNIEYLGVELSWVHIIFSLNALRQNMKFIESNKLDLATFLSLEYWLERSMNEFDEVGARTLIPYIDGAIESTNKHIYLYMRSINADYFTMGGGKLAFRKLSTLLRKAIYYTPEYNEHLEFLNKEAKRLKCEINDLELTDDHINYDIKW
ncbi:hypothetical protein J7E50_09770 [Pedobacter sp. ISL-68]|uniref:DUF6904 family protein n=1 Tax=unclassified Pedobacter TaxID=2628915 RepID=UPI001BE514A5|nr:MULTISPECIES: hypothetical protein [unclassified Pedobacter]MBT2561117.1 hypothetical protein [Pedobacter sp. ISL-64]MBT2590506.1 hypothetical protein [Pedobacter sp. ISL-68]